MKNVKVSELKIGNIFTESMQLTKRESYTVESVVNETVFAMGNNYGKQKPFSMDQTKQVILLKES